MNHPWQDLRRSFGARFDRIAKDRKLATDGLLDLEETANVDEGVTHGLSPRSDTSQYAQPLLNDHEYRVSTKQRPTLLVPGLLGSSIRNLVAPFMCSRTQLQSFGYDIDIAWVNGRSGCDTNAKFLRESILRTADSRGSSLNIIAYSKGCADCLHMLGEYPDTHDAIHALVSLAGVVNGTPLAHDPSWLLRKILQYAPLPNVPIGDGRAIVDLSCDVRKQWLEDHTLPQNIYLASVVAAPSQCRVSRVLQGSYKKLAKINPANDSQVIATDAILPYSDLLAIVNADHWAVALPVKERLPLVARLLVDKNTFPRNVLLHALIDHLDSVRK